MYFDYLDLKVAEKRLSDPEFKSLSMDDFFQELGLDVQDWFCNHCEKRF